MFIPVEAMKAYWGVYVQLFSILSSEADGEE
jgi:hypothetical protein